MKTRVHGDGKSRASDRIPDSRHSFRQHSRFQARLLMRGPVRGWKTTRSRVRSEKGEVPCEVGFQALASFCNLIMCQHPSSYSTTSPSFCLLLPFFPLQHLVLNTLGPPSALGVSWEPIAYRGPLFPSNGGFPMSSTVCPLNPV